MAKIVLISNFGMETFAERLIEENLILSVAISKVSEMQQKVGDNDDGYPVVRPDDYVLWRGMADLVGEPEKESK